MDYFVNVKKLGDKLAETLDEHKLLHVFDTSKYPITLTVRQNKAPDAQMELFETSDSRMSSQDCVLRFTFDLGGVEMQTENRLVISDALLSKVKGLAKKMHQAYLEAYFASRRNPERLRLYGDPDAGFTPNSSSEDDSEGDEGSEEAFAGFYDGDETEDGAGE